MLSGQKGASGQGEGRARWASSRAGCMHTQFIISGPESKSLGGVVEGAHDVVVAVDVDLVVAVEGDLAATVLGEEDDVADLDGHLTEDSVLHNAAGTDSDDGALVELLTLVGVGQDDTGLGLGLSDDFLDHNTVGKGLEGLEREHS